MNEELGIFIVGAIAFLGSYVAYGIVSLISAPFIAGKREKERGTYYENRFVYHSPLHIQTILITPQDNEKKLKVTVKDAEPNSFVLFKLDYDKGKGYLSVGPLLGGENTELIRKIEYGIRLNSKREAFFTMYSFKDSDPTIARISILCWEINDNNTPGTIDQRPLQIEKIMRNGK